jgi:hypothetical protein
MMEVGLGPAEVISRIGDEFVRVSFLSIFCLAPSLLVGFVREALSSKLVKV